MSLSLILIVLLAGTWCLVIGEVSLGQALLGLLFGTAFVLLTGLGRGRTVAWSRIPGHAYYLAIYLLVVTPYDIARSNLELARRLLYPQPHIRPGIVRIRLGDVSEATSALVGHAITIGPGNMVVDYSADGRTVYVHMVDIRKAEEQERSFWRLYARLLRRVF